MFAGLMRQSLLHERRNIGGVAANAITFGGEPVTFNSDTVTFGA